MNLTFPTKAIESPWRLMWLAAMQRTDILRGRLGLRLALTVNKIQNRNKIQHIVCQHISYPHANY